MKTILNFVTSSERVFFGILFIGGYIMIGAFGVVIPMSPQQSEQTKDVLLVLGPIIGGVAKAIFDQAVVIAKNQKETEQ